MSKRRIPELDGIRGLAILLVMIWHFLAIPLSRSVHPLNKFSGRLLMFTWSGVDLFFVLSGFLIGGILIDSKESPRYFSTFYVRRFFRIIPLYAAVCLSYFPLALIAKMVFHAKLWAMPWWSYATFSQNLWLNNARWGVYLNQTWSLAVEEQFYLTLPLLIWLVSPKNLWKVAVAGIAGVVGFRILLWSLFHGSAATAIYVMLPCRADSLLMGLLAAIVMRDERAQMAIQANRAWLAIIMGAWVAVLGVLISKEAGVFSREMSTFGYGGFGLFYVSLLLLTVTSNGWLRRWFSNPALRWMGTIAYGIYLLHTPILDVSVSVFPQRPIAALAVAIPVYLVLSHLSWKLFESRMIEIGHRYSRKLEENEAAKVTVPLNSDSLTPICEAE